MISDVLGKFTIPSHLTESIHLHCLPGEMEKEIHRFQPINISKVINQLLHHTTQQPLQPHPWKFERTKEAAQHNALIISTNDFDLEKATQSIHNTIMSYGSEFKPWKYLSPLFQAHPLLNPIQEAITNGVSYPLQPIDEESRLKDIQYMIERGNHKSAAVDENRQALEKAFEKEVKNCWMIPIPIHIIKCIPGT